MTLLVDTRSIAPANRPDAFHVAFNSASKPTRVDIAGDVTGRLRAWSLQAGATLMSLDIRVDHLTLTRSAKHLRHDDSARLSVALSLTGTCTTTNHDVELASNDILRLTDLTSTYGIHQHGRCHAVAFEIDYDALGISVDRTRHAIPNARFSPLHELLRHHLGGLAQAAPRLSAGTLVTTGTATAELVRAMLQSISPDDRERRAALADILPQRIDDYVRRHLHDPTLTLDRIAAAHNISLRYLYVLLARSTQTPAEWIISRRLAAAHDELVHRPTSTTVAGLARRCGFKSAAHFSRRFKNAYGVSPSELLKWPQSIRTPWDSSFTLHSVSDGTSPAYATRSR